MVSSTNLGVAKLFLQSVRTKTSPVPKITDYLLIEVAPPRLTGTPWYCLWIPPHRSPTPRKPHVPNSKARCRDLFATPRCQAQKVEESLHFNANFCIFHPWVCISVRSHKRVFCSYMLDYQFIRESLACEIQKTDLFFGVLSSKLLPAIFLWHRLESHTVSFLRIL